MREVTLDSGFTIFEAAYEYAFMHSENYELAGTIGLHYTTLELKLTAETAGGGAVALADPRLSMRRCR